MANLILRLIKNQATGKQELLVDYESDGDRLPFEHEEEHRRWLKKILEESGEISGEGETLIIERDPISQQKDQTPWESEDQKESKRLKT